MSSKLAEKLLQIARITHDTPPPGASRWEVLAQIARRLERALPDSAELRALVNGAACCARVDRYAAWAINVANFVWGHYIVTRAAGADGVAFNLAEISKLCPEAQDLQTVLRELTSFNELDLKRVAEAGSIASLVPAGPSVREIKNLAITVPAFNAPELIAELLSALQDNADLFDWRAPIVLFDGSSDTDAQRQIERLAARYDVKPCRVIYLGRTHASVTALLPVDAFVAHVAAVLNDASIKDLFTTSVGGNLNCCFSYFGPDVSILNFDHDVLPSVEVDAATLDRLETSAVESAGDLFVVERGGAPSGKGVDIPVDFMSAVRSCDALCLTGDEDRGGDDESYRALRLRPATGEAEYWVTHIAGIQDHSARCLLEGVIAERKSLRGAEPSRFAPIAPALPALAFRSKLITTTLTLRVAGTAGPTLGFAGTRVRVQDFITGALHYASTGKPIGWVPVYLTHNRKFGFRGEEDFGGYLQNEEIMYAFLGALEAIEQRAARALVSNLADAWREEAERVLSPAWAGTVRAQHWCEALECDPVDASYERAATSIRNHFMLDRPEDEAGARLLAYAHAEASLVERHLRTREKLDVVLREQGVARFLAAAQGRCDDA